ncbi:MAG TPA: hypothetical protein VI583_13415 [Cyclobacteriaceae bacterium]|nr:hypothetical protein [Cyclobacteriaceae bacterium]
MRINSGIPLTMSCIFIFSLVDRVYSQQAGEDYVETEATQSNAKPEARDMGPKKNKIAYLIKNNPAGTLYGNPCFKEVSHKFGFEYLIVPAGVAPNSNGLSRSAHNLGVNIKLFFRNGPLWKSRMKKKFERCKYGYGDFVG